MTDGTHSLYPGFVKLFYTVGTFEHTLTLPVKPYQAVGGAWSLEFKGDSLGGPWGTNVTAFITAIKPLMSTTTTFLYAELWTMSSAEADPLYVDTVVLNIVGTSASAFTTAGQVVFSGRSALGGTVKLYLMEPGLAVNLKLKPTYAAPYAAVVTYLTGATSIAFARDGGGWVAVPQVTTKTNDKLRKQRGLV